MKRIFIASAILCLTLISGTAFASQVKNITIPAAEPVSPPVSTHLETGIKTLVPFRIWVTPYSDNGIQTAGHYEFFEMYMDMGDSKLVIDSKGQEPAVKAVVTEVMGQPAVK